MRFQRMTTEESRKKDLSARTAAIERELDEAREAGDALAAAIALNNLGTVHADLEEWDKAYDSYAEAAEQVPAEASLDDRATPHGNAANAARRLHRWPEALTHALWVDALAGEADSDDQRAIASGAVGLVRKATGDEFEALLDTAVAALPEALQPHVRREAHLHPTVVAKEVPGRNDPCWCGSGKKYKHCHMKADQAAS